MKCPNKNIECLNWTGNECTEKKCPYEGFDVYKAVDRIAEGMKEEEYKGHWSDEL